MSTCHYLYDEGHEAFLRLQYEIIKSDSDIAGGASPTCTVESQRVLTDTAYVLRAYPEELYNTAAQVWYATGVSGKIDWGCAEAGLVWQQKTFTFTIAFSYARPVQARIFKNIRPSARDKFVLTQINSTNGWWAWEWAQELLAESLSPPHEHLQSQGALDWLDFEDDGKKLRVSVANRGNRGLCMWLEQLDPHVAEL
jgi:hypothetical protein